MVIILLAVIAVLLTALIILSVEYLRLRKMQKYLDKANMWYKLAYTDDLTGLYNRTAYNRDMSVKNRKGKKNFCGILLFDVDNFKQINDTEGHLAGDAVLKMVGEMLADVFKKTYLKVYRIGGDEFAVIARGGDEEELIGLMIELNEKLEAETDIRLSKGYAIVKDDAVRAFDDADDMLYADKASKKVGR